MPIIRLPTMLLAVLSGLAYAGDSGQTRPAGVVSSADVLQWMAGLVLVLLLFGLFVWLIRKTGHFSFESKNQLAVLTALSLGMREKLVLIKVGEKQLLLGVTPGRVDKLLELEGDDRLFQDPAEKGAGGLFAKKLQQVMRGNPDA